MMSEGELIHPEQRQQHPFKERMDSDTIRITRVGHLSLFP